MLLLHAYAVDLRYAMPLLIARCHGVIHTSQRGAAGFATL